MIGIVYLSNYSVALSSLAFHTFYLYPREMGYNTHRITLEKRGKALQITDHDTRSFQLDRFSAIMVSLPYEILYKDLSTFLKLAGIPIFSMSREKHPLIIGGGPAVTSNPLPVSKLLDVVVVGEAEELLEDMLSIIESDYPRNSKLKMLSELRGIYVPRYTERVERVYVENLDNSFHPINQIVEENVTPIWGRSLLVEASRGCARGCIFCMEGRIFLPARHRSYATLSTIIEEGTRFTGQRKISFYSLSFFDNPAADKILEKIVSEGLQASIPSVRLDTLNEYRLHLIREVGQKTLTIAPETGSCSLARAIKKNLCISNTIPIVEEAAKIGFPTIKLYVITGFLGETDEMYKSTLSMIKEALHVTRKYGSRLRVTLNPLIPKPHTPLQWQGLPAKTLIKKRFEQLKRELRGSHIDIDLYDFRYARIQTILSRGDEKLSKTIAVWGDHDGYLSGWRRAIKETRLEEQHYLESWSPEFVPPWHNVVIDRFNRVELLSKIYRYYVEYMSRITSRR